MKTSKSVLFNGALYQLVLLILLSIPAWAGEDLIRMTGIGPSYQINKHDAKNRFCYDGSCIIHGTGEIHIRLNKLKNSGIVDAYFSGADGEWRIVQEKFKKIATDVNLHGATGGDIEKSLSPPVLPQVWTYVATWGPGTVYHNGKMVWKGPAHLMVTEEVRDPLTGKVDFKGPKMAKQYPGSIYNKRGIQIHFVAHPKEKPVKGYFPPFTRVVHLMWDTVIWH